MTVRQRKARKHYETPEEEVARKRQEFKAAERAYEDACIKKHGKKSTCDELGSFMMTAAKGVGTVLGTMGRAAQEMGRMTEEDLYIHSPAGQRDRAIMRMMRNEKSGSSIKPGTHSRARKPQYVVITNKDGSIKEIVDKSQVQDNTRRRRR
jgi:hypothetical protein